MYPAFDPGVTTIGADVATPIQAASSAALMEAAKSLCTLDIAGEEKVSGISRRMSGFS
jgi:hypothetical protein